MTTTASKVQEEVVQVVRSKTPADELNLALEMNKGRLPSIMPVVVEEKKDEDPPLTATGAFVEEIEQPSEEGQEALWVDNVKDLPKGDQSGNASPSASPSRRWKLPSPTRSPSRLKKTGDYLQDHVYLLPNKEHPVKPSPLDLVQVRNKEELKNKKEAAAKVKTARELLEQALSPDANLGSRDLLAQAAFEHATEARHLVEASVTPELETLILDAKEKGKSEVAKMRQLQLQETNAVAATSKDEIPASKSEESQDDHASRARNLLEFILPEVDFAEVPVASSSPKPKKPKSPDDVSTLGFDNTYVGKGASKDFDILSMSSLNEILDGPMDEDPNFPVLKHRIIPDEEVENDDTLEVKKAKRASLFGAMFRSKLKDQAAGNASKPNESTATDSGAKESANNMAVKEEEKEIPTTENASKENKRSRKKKFAAKKVIEQKSNIVTTVLIDDGPTHPNGIEDTQCEIANTEELERIKAIDVRLNKTLKEAIDTDDTESLTSYQGVALHGESGDEKEKKDKKKRKGVKMTDEEEPRRTPPRQFDKIKPQFMAAPRGDPGILTSKSWESIGSDEEKEKEQVAATVTADAEKEGSEEDVEDESQKEKIEPSADVPSSPGSSAADAAGDRYVIPSNDQAVEDRYAVANDEASFEAFWDPCGSSNQLTIVQANETCSTLGMAAASCLSGHTAAIEAEKDELPEPTVDKYAPTPAAATAKTEDEEKSLENTKPSNGEMATTSAAAANRIISNAEPAVTSTGAESQKNASTKMRKANSTRAEKLATKKRLKMRGFGIFGGRKANTAPNKSRSTTPTKTTPTRLTAEKSNRSTPRKLLRSKRQKDEKEEDDTLVQQTKISVFTETHPTANAGVAETGKEETAKSPENTRIESDAGEPKTDVVDVDPLVAHIKNQMSRSTSRGRDPSTAEEEAACKGLEP